MIPVLALLALVVTPMAILLAFGLYLRFCRFVVLQTGDTKGLRDVSTAMRAFGVLPLPRNRSR